MITNKASVSIHVSFLCEHVLSFFLVRYLGTYWLDLIIVHVARFLKSCQSVLQNGVVLCFGTFPLGVYEATPGPSLVLTAFDISSMLVGVSGQLTVFICPSLTMSDRESVFVSLFSHLYIWVKFVFKPFAH